MTDIDALIARLRDRLHLMQIDGLEVLIETGRQAADALTAERALSDRQKALLWMAWREFNAIRARAGSPLDHYGICTCDHDFWDCMTEALAEAGGSTLPWPADDAMRAHIDVALTAHTEAREGKE